MKSNRRYCPDVPALCVSCASWSGILLMCRFAWSIDAAVKLACLCCRATTTRMACKGEMSSTGVLSTLQIRCGGSDEFTHFCTVCSEHGVMHTGVWYLNPLTDVLRLCVCTQKPQLYNASGFLSFCGAGLLLIGVLTLCLVLWVD